MEWRIPASLPYGGVYRGLDGVADFYRALDSYWVHYWLHIETQIPAHDHVVSLGRVEGKGARSRFDAPIALIWRFRSGRILKMTQYTDTAVLVAALGRGDENHQPNRSPGMGVEQDDA